MKQNNNGKNNKNLVHNWALRKGVFYPTSEIYNSIAGFYDYGSLGFKIKKNWEEQWRNYFLNEDNFYEIEGNFILQESVLKASGHVDNFNDPLTECKKCREKFRADNLVEDTIDINAEGMSNDEITNLINSRNIPCPSCGGELGEVKTFGLMFDLKIGPLTDKDLINDLINYSKKDDKENVKKILEKIEKIREKEQRAFLRPETAQIPYLNFKREFEINRGKLPLGLASIGKAFRNEISPRQGLFRLREFNQAELQIFFDSDNLDINKKDIVDEWKNLEIVYKNENNGEEGKIKFKEFVKKFSLPSMYAYYLGKLYNFYSNVMKLGENIRVRQLTDDEKAFYNKIHFDFEYFFNSYESWKEIGGLHYRTNHDLGKHSEFSGEDLGVNIEGKKFIPHVLELSFGEDRNILALIDNSLEEEKVNDENRIVFKAENFEPYKIAIMPLLSNKEVLVKKAEEIFNMLNKNFSQQITLDIKGSIGKRYRRQDEIGTKHCVTVDFETVEEGELKNSVTLRERDSMKQKRVNIDDLENYLVNNF